MRTQKTSAKRKIKAPVVDVPAMRERLNKLDKGDWIVVYDEKRGRKRVSFVRVTRAGKGNDLMIDEPKRERGAMTPTDYVRKVIPIADVLSLLGKPPATAKTTAQRPEEGWRELAEEVIASMHEFATESDGDLRQNMFKKVSVFRQRAFKLAGQLEMFTIVLIALLCAACVDPKPTPPPIPWPTPLPPPDVDAGVDGGASCYATTIPCDGGQP